MTRLYVVALLLATAMNVFAEDDGQWTLPGKNYALHRYSELPEITTQNVKNLRVAWTFSTGYVRGHEAAPLVSGKTMYIICPFPNTLYALDLENSGAMKWKYEPRPAAAAQGVACCDLVNRGGCVVDGKVVYNTLDCHTVCIDAETGKQLWKTKLGDINKGETITMAPLVIKDKVLVGNSGGELGVRGWLTAVDLKSGKIVWRAYSTGPDQDCLIGGRFKPFYSMDQGTDLGTKTWPGDHWQIGGGTVWGWLSYDPQLNLVYYGTSNPGVWNPDLRPGDNKWSCAVIARDPDNGQAVWAYQYTPHDLWDHDGVNEHVLIDVDHNGQQTPAFIHPDRNGHMYVMDRKTGQVLSADTFCRNTISKGVDLKTGRLIPNEEKTPQTGKVVRDIQPFAPGAKDWQPACYSPKLKWLITPVNNMAMDHEAVEANYIAGTPYVGANVRMYAGPGGNRGELIAWDIANRRRVWTIKEDFPVWSGTFVTSTDLVFYGTMEGWFKAVNAKTGEVLWKFKTGSGIISQPMTYKGPDGKQYVAVVCGVGGWSGAIVAGGLDPRDTTAALGFAGGMADLPNHTNKGGMVYVFSLP